MILFEASNFTSEVVDYAQMSVGIQVITLDRHASFKTSLYICGHLQEIMRSLDIPYLPQKKTIQISCRLAERYL